MSLNPIQFGEHVVEQFQRYLLTYFPIADADMEAQVREHLKRRPGGERKLVKGPFIHLNQPFEPGPMLADLQAELDLHPALPGLFRFDQLYKHQELATRAILEGRHTVMATATGSGKTEGFLLPILDHCLRMRDENAAPGVVAALVYPMNALVNDQMDRLRLMLAGTGITFARYTGETPYTTPDNLRHLRQSRPYTQGELRAHREENADLPRPWEEAVSREEIRERRPRLLLTNYRMLEYLLLRHRDLVELMEDAPLRFMVFDEVHTYTGTLGSEVACLIRRLRHVAGKQPDEVVCIGTSATVRPEEGLDADALTRTFAHRLFGVPESDVDVVGEQYREPEDPPEDSYTPPRPEDPQALLDEMLNTARDVHLQEEVEEVPPELLAAAEQLCGRTAPEQGSVSDRMYRLLAANEIVQHLSRRVTRPLTLEDLHNRLRQVGDRADASEDDLTAEAMAYLTLGAICQRDDEPLLRPKLHYFVQGYPGLWVSFEPKDPDATADSPIRPVIHFHGEQREDDGATGARLPLMLCRACGQHYLRAIAEEAWAAEGDNAVMPVRTADPWEQPGADEFVCYLTDRLHTQEEDAGGDVWHLCRWCGALHREATVDCQHERCARTGPLVPVLVFRDELNRCEACGSLQTISGTRSAEVADVNTLAESMLSAMQEPTLRKLLIFSDSRQEAAFQAGWMRERSRRHELRHLLYEILHAADGPLTLGALTDRLMGRAEEADVPHVGPREQDLEEAETRIRWFVLQEFASPRERRGSLETLGLARIEYEGLSERADPDFFKRWASVFGLDPPAVADIVRTLLDYYRRRGTVTDDLMQQWWSYRDPEVRKGLVSVGEWWRPSVLTLTKAEAPVTTKSLLASQGQTAAQHIVGKAVREGAARGDEFLGELWEWLQDDQHQFLEPAEITQRQRGQPRRVSIGERACQVAADRLLFGPASSRYMCNVCRTAQAVSLPGAACPEYRCDGTLRSADVDEEHYAVVRYTREEFVPLHPVEHSGQVDKDTREWIEDEFKKDDGEVNCIVCTPTLELGVDIGQLEMALMRNVPPTPANYAQRAGRAGRRHRIAVVMEYCGTSPHDRYHFERPEEMIDGRIRIPAFSMSNEPMVRKHAHSAILTALRRSSDAGVGEVLGESFPRYVWRYFMAPGGERGPGTRYLPEPPTFPSLHSLVDRHADELRHQLMATFTSTWPTDEGDVVSGQRLDDLIDKMPTWLEGHVDVLCRQVNSYRNRIKHYAEKELSNEDLTPEEQRERDRCQYAVDTLKREDQNRYTLTYLSNDGYFPGYALTRETCVGRCLRPYIELQRPQAIALREFTPANWLYGSGDVYAVSRVEFFSLSTAEGTPDVKRRDMLYDADHDRLIDPDASDREGHEGDPFTSFQLGGVELRQRQQIDDSSDRRHYGAQDIVGTFLGTHRGGQSGPLGDIEWRLYRQADLRLVNLGPVGREREALPIGFPICSVCGAVRSPYQSEAEIEEFEGYHTETCGAEAVGWAALHVDFRSDLLELGPLPDRAQAVNLMEAVLTGAREVLDMGEAELEGFVEERGEGEDWVLIYDPMPGGSGFLQQLRPHWQTVCLRAQEILETCDCDEACYGCLLTFWNQRHHAVLSRMTAIEVVRAYEGEMEFGTTIPPHFPEPEDEDVEEESDAEQLFLQILKDRHFPEPRKQHQVTLGDGTTTFADFAYPGEKVLIYIDGMSEQLHGDPERRRADHLTRVKLRSKDYQVVESTAEALHDQTAVNRMLNEIAIYLGREDLLSD